MKILKASECDRACDRASVKWKRAYEMCVLLWYHFKCVNQLF